MRVALALALLPGAACASTPSTESTAEHANFAFADVSVVDVQSGRVLPGRTVLIAGNRIQRVGPSARAEIPAGAQVVGATGKYLIPGLWICLNRPRFCGGAVLEFRHEPCVLRRR